METSTLTLREKEAALLETIAVPTAEDWQLLCDDQDVPDVVAAANQILIEALDDVKSRHSFSIGYLCSRVYGPLKELEARCGAGLLDSEGAVTVARFFAVNYDPRLYDDLRYGSAAGVRSASDH